MPNVTFKGNATRLDGTSVNVGDRAPEVELVAGDLSVFKVGGAQGKYQIINVVPSLDTGVCSAQARKFNEKAAALDNAVVFVVSFDLPFAQTRFCSTEGIQNLKTLSDFRGGKFSKSYGVFIGDGVLAGLSARAVFVIDPNGKIVHKEIVSEITNEPNYDAAIAALKQS